MPNNNLIPIIKRGESEQWVDARNLHSFVESKQEFANWIKPFIQEFGFIEGRDFLKILSKSTGGRQAIEYTITLDMAKHLAMLQRNEKGMQARQYFINAEKELRTLQAALLTGYDEMDKLLAKCKTRWHEGIEWYPATQLRRLACKSYCNQQRYHALAAQGHCIKLPTGLQDRWYVKKEAVNELLYVKANTHLSVSIVNLIHTNY